MSRELLLEGDCLEVLDSVPPHSIDLVVCDLPYATTKCRWDSPIDLPVLWKHYYRIVKPNAAVVLFAQTPFDKVLGCSNLSWLRYEWVWRKGNATGHLNAKKMPLKQHENILVFYDSLPTYNPQKTTGHTRKTATKRKDVTKVYGQQTFVELSYDSSDRYPLSVIDFPSDKQLSKLHSTQKPLALIEYLVKTYSNRGDTVLDNCMGSNTTGLACQNLGRDFIGIEKDPAIFEIAKQRTMKVSNE